MRTTLLVFITLFTQALFAHDGGTLKGKITSNGEPVGSVNVYLKDTKIGTTTDFDGNYTLKIPAGNFTLIVQAVGFKTIEKKITSKKHEILPLNFSLKEDVLGLDQVVVTATRRHLNRKIAPVIVTVTDAKIFNATQSVSLSEGLNFQPGLRMETNCQNCGFSQVKMNGLSGAYSQILVDSRPIFSALNGVYGLDQIPSNIIDRIEVVRGGGSALYGSNAIAGTINIITKDPKENSFQVGTNSSFIGGNTTDNAVTVNGTVVSEDFDAGIAVFGLFRNRGAFDYDNDGFTEITRMKNNTLGLKSFFRPTERQKFTAEFNATHENRRGGNDLHLLPFQSDITEEITSDVINGGLTYEYLSDNLKHNLSFYTSTSYSKNNNFYGGKGEDDPRTPENEELTDGVKGYGNSKDNTWVLGGQYAYDFDKFLGGSGTFTGGIEYKYDDMLDTKAHDIRPPVDQILRIYGVYAQQEWKVNEKLRLLGGLRADKHNKTDENVIFNPRFNILYNITDNLQFRSSYAKGFRAPQVFTEDLHASVAAGEVSVVFVDETKLVSETSHSYLASFDWSKEFENGDISLTVEGFYTKLKNPFILEQIEGTNNWEKLNGQGAEVKGINLEFKYAPNIQWILQAGGTIQESKYNEPVAWTDDPSISLENADNFFKSPNFYGNFVITYAPTKKFQNNLSGVYTGSMYVPHLAGYITQDKLEKTPDFFELNAKTSYTFSLDDHDHLQLQLSGGIQNIFDSYQQDFDQGALRDATYIYGPSRPRTYFIGLKFGTNL